MDQEDLSRKRRRLFEPHNLVDLTEDAPNTDASRMRAFQNDATHSGAQQPPSGSNLDIDSGLEILTNMGFDIKRATKAMKSAGGDVQGAIDRLFSSSAGTFEDEDRASRPQTSNHDDEALARQLQAEYDDRPQTGASQQVKRDDSGINEDEAYARSLQARLNGADHESSLESDAPLTPSTEEITSIGSDLQPSQVEGVVRKIAEAVTGFKCLNCRKYIVKNESHILDFSKYIQDSEGRLIATPCHSCRNPHNDQRARLYMIWALLCDFDASSKHNKPDKRQNTKPTKIPKNTPSSGTGYGDGYGSSARQSAGVNEPAAVQLSNADNTMTAALVNTLHSLLPTFDREDDSELDAKQLQALFLCSSLLERAAELLRNNDLEEVTTQRALYDALARLLQTLAMHPATSTLVFGERVVRASGATLLRISLGKASLAGGKEVDTVQPLSQCLQEFAAQGSLILGSQVFDANEAQLFRAFIDLRDFLQANGSSIKKASKQDRNAWHKEYAVSEVPDEYILANHCLATKAQTGQLLPGRVKRIMHEISRLHTSLPEGIFVRYGSSRPDVMKAIIIGPQGTPYENGLFEFDLLCGNNFPAGPPQMQLRTTGGGAVRFNPNLYNCGKVCLSLLGTWQGEKWNAKTSTLLQVLVSIQAMIFCVHPWFNEPGRGQTDSSNQQSIAYNKAIQPQTIQYGMISWLEGKSYQNSQNRPAQSQWTSMTNYDESIWSAIIENHFHANENNVRATVSKWTSEVGGVPTRDLTDISTGRCLC